MGKKGLRALKRKIAPSWFLRSHLATDFEHEEEQFKELTDQQFAILEFLSQKPRAMIAGCAGSGKTMLAMEKARQLAKQGLRVLFTCYNRNLAEWLNQRPHDQEQITISHFHSLAMQMVKNAGVDIAPVPGFGGETEKYWSVTVPEALFDAAIKLPTSRRFDAIIVDEGQDFRSAYWTPLQALLKDPDEGILYIFYDDSQRLYSEDDFPFPEPAGRLDRNLRNTYEIGLKVCDYYSGPGTIRAGGPVTGRNIETVDMSKCCSQVQALADVLTMLRDEKIPPDHIVILSPLGDRKSRWKQGTKVGDYTLIRRGRTGGKRVLVETIHGFKGLERPAVILNELDQGSFEDRDSLLYVALSRARNHVVILGKLPPPSSK